MTKSLFYYQAFQDGYYHLPMKEKDNSFYQKAYLNGKQKRLLEDYFDIHKTKEALAFENEQLYKS